MKILIVKTSALGDIIQSFSILNFLHVFLPHAEIDWVVDLSFVELLEAHPYVHRVIPLDSKRWKGAPCAKGTRGEMGRFIHLLRERRYDAIFDLQGNVKSGTITALSRGRDKIGWTLSSAPEWPSSLPLSHRYAPSSVKAVACHYLFLVQRHFSVVPRWISPKVTLALKKRDEALREEVRAIISSSEMRFMICPGSRWENKRLFLTTWLDFLRGIAAEIDHPFFFFVWGEDRDKEDVELLHAAFPTTSAILPKMSLPLLQWAMGEMCGVISVDSAALHLASTTSTPSLGLFGPSSHLAYTPIGEGHVAFQGGCPYGQAFFKRCAFLRSCPTGACLKEVASASLIRAFLRGSWRYRSVSGINAPLRSG